MLTNGQRIIEVPRGPFSYSWAMTSSKIRRGDGPVVAMGLWQASRMPKYRMIGIESFLEVPLSE